VSFNLRSIHPFTPPFFSRFISLFHFQCVCLHMCVLMQECLHTMSLCVCGFVRLCALVSVCSFLPETNSASSSLCQITHKSPERRLLVSSSCGQLAPFVDSSIRSSLILSILQQLCDDPEPHVRESVARNLCLLIPLYQDANKYSKVCVRAHAPMRVCVCVCVLLECI
jgi:hypothetical protein